MASTKERVIEPHARHIGSAQLFINADASWSVGPSTRSLVKVTFGDIKSIDDTTFGFSSLAVETDGKGGYRLFVRSDSANDTIVEVTVNAAGQVDAASVTLLSQAQLYAVENQFKLDLNDNGGFGDEPVLLEGGAVNLYMAALGGFQVGSGSAAPVSLRLGSEELTEELLPAGWSIVEVQPDAGGYKVYAQDPSGAVYAANFSASGEYTGGSLLSDAQLTQLELSEGLDIDGDSDLPAPDGWTTALKDPAIRTSVEAALAGDTTKPKSSLGLAGPQATEPPAKGVSYAEVVAVMQAVISTHKSAGNAPITADEVTSLQALAARGKAAFAGNTASEIDYLSYVFSRMVESSDANRFFTGGESQRSELGSLSAGMPLVQFEKLVAKWLLGGDLPNTATAGDTATGNAQAVKAGYAKSTGGLFVDGIAIADVNQGSAGDCYLIAVFGGLAGSKPETIQAMIVENPTIDGTRTWGVRFFDTAGKAHWVTVNDMLPARPDDSSKLAYAGSAGKDLNGEIWVPLLEKAYAQVNTLGILPRNERIGQNSYLAVEGGHGDPLVQIAAGKATMYSVTQDPAALAATSVGGNPYLAFKGVDGSKPAEVEALVATLTTASNAGKVIWIGVTTTQKDSFGNQLLVGSHAHYALDATPADPANNTVLVYNPWGLQPLPEPPGPIAAQFASPVPYTLAQLVGIVGLDFVILDGVGS